MEMVSALVHFPPMLVSSETAPEQKREPVPEISQPQAPSLSLPAMILVLMVRDSDTHIPDSKWREDKNESQGLWQSSLKKIPKSYWNICSFPLARTLPPVTIRCARGWERELPSGWPCTLPKFLQWKKLSWECGSGVECLPSVHETSSSILEQRKWEDWG